MNGLFNVLSLNSKTHHSPGLLCDLSAIDVTSLPKDISVHSQEWKIMVLLVKVVWTFHFSWLEDSITKDAVFCADISPAKLMAHLLEMGFQTGSTYDKRVKKQQMSKPHSVSLDEFQG